LSFQNDYFAAAKADVLAAELLTRAENSLTHQKQIGLISKWTQSYNFYYGNHFKTGAGDSAIKSAGTHGELKLLTINQYRNLLRHMLIMTTAQRPAWDCRAVNTDPRSLTSAKLGGNILDYYMFEKRLGRYFKRAGETALVLSKGFLKATWDPSLGRPYGRKSVKDANGQNLVDSDGVPMTKIEYEGDISVSCHMPQDVFYDEGLEDFAQADWVCVRVWKNKYNLAARHPDLREKILALPTKRDVMKSYQMGFTSLEDSSLVEIFEFYHKKTEALPNGRCSFFGKGVELYDGPFPYEKRLPVFRIVPGEILGTAEGYTDGFDLLSIQEAIDTLSSIIFTNQNAHGVQSILMPEGCNMTAVQIAQGLRAIKYNPASGKPEPMQLTSTPPEIFKFLEMLERFAETISGVNSVARGNPDSSLKSGVALGLVQSMALQFASGFQESWVELLEDVGTFILCDLLKNFAENDRMVAIAGKNNRGYMSKFKGKDLLPIDRVIVDLGNPMSRTTGGRVAMADNLLEKGMIKTPQEYLTVLNTGQLEPAIQGTEAELALIRQENDDLLEGKDVVGLAFDKHLLHMQEHSVLFANPEIRRSPQLLQKALEHWQWHKQTYQTQDPIVAMVSGEPPAPMPPPPPGMPPIGPPPGPGAPMEPPPGGAGMPMPPMPQDLMAPQTNLAAINPPMPEGVPNA